MSDPSFLDRIDDVPELYFRIGVFAMGAIVLFVLLSLRFCYDVELPPKAKKPAPTEATPDEVSDVLAAHVDVYKGYLRDDAKSYGVAEPTLEDMRQPFAHRADDTVVVLKPGTGEASVEAAGLRLTAAVQGGRRSQDKRLVLTIDNLTDEHLAYWVETKPTRGVQMCKHQLLRHNGMVLEPGGTVTRAECSYKKGVTLKVVRVETLALPPLSARYVSAVAPIAIGLDPRPVGTYHTPMDGVKLCNVVIATSVIDGVREGKGDVTWRDLVDFYARHRCTGATYSVPDGYRAFEKGDERRLPVVSGD